MFSSYLKKKLIACKNWQTIDHSFLMHLNTSEIKIKNANNDNLNVGLSMEAFIEIRLFVSEWCHSFFFYVKKIRLGLKWLLYWSRPFCKRYHLPRRCDLTARPLLAWAARFPKRPLKMCHARVWFFGARWWYLYTFVPAHQSLPCFDLCPKVSVWALNLNPKTVAPRWLQAWEFYNGERKKKERMEALPP